MIAVQAEGCAPIPRAFAAGQGRLREISRRPDLRVGPARSQGLRRLPDPALRPRVRRRRGRRQRRRDASGLRRARGRGGSLRVAGGRRGLGRGEAARGDGALDRPPGSSSSTRDPGSSTLAETETHEPARGADRRLEAALGRLQRLLWAQRYGLAARGHPRPGRDSSTRTNPFSASVEAENEGKLLGSDALSLPQSKTLRRRNQNSRAICRTCSRLPLCEVEESGGP